MTDPGQADAFYRAAALGLQALDHLENRALRFGPDADSRWARFRGHLDDTDRLHVLLRDAAIKWGLAFSAAGVFRLPGVASDEPFGAAWTPADPERARRYLDTPTPPSLAACAEALGVVAHPVDLPELKTGTLLWVGGASAILATAAAFVGRGDLDWERQVTVVADDPVPRQLAGLAALFLQTPKPGAIVTSDLVPADVEGVVSADAEPAVRAALKG